MLAFIPGLRRTHEQAAGICTRQACRAILNRTKAGHIAILGYSDRLMMEPLGYVSVVLRLAGLYLIGLRSIVSQELYRSFLPARKDHGFPHTMPRRTVVSSPGHPITPYRILDVDFSMFCHHTLHLALLQNEILQFGRRSTITFYAPLKE